MALPPAYLDTRFAEKKIPGVLRPAYGNIAVAGVLPPAYGIAFDPLQLFDGSSADAGVLYTDPLLQYETSVSPWAAADANADPVGLILSRLGDGRGVVNILLETDTLATQNVTTEAVEYTLSFVGTGTVTLTGTSTDGPLVGTGANDRVELTFTPTAGTLTLTVSGTVEDGQLEEGDAFTTYQANTYTVGGPGIHASQATAGSRPGVASIPRGGRRNQFASDTDTFTTRNFTTAAVEYTLSCEGAVGETITLTGTSTAGPLTCTGAGNRVSLTFTPTAGTLTLTKSAGSVTDAQIEFGAADTAYQSVTSNFLVTEDGVPQVEIEYYDGGDWLTLGTQSFGTASFFADAGQAWWVGFAFSAFVGGAIIAKASGTASSRTLHIFCGSAVNGVESIVRGSSDALSPGSIVDGALHVGLLVWDGSALTAYIDDNAGVDVTVGAAAEEAQNITIGAARESSPFGFFTGYNRITGFEDRALSATEVSQYMSSMNQYWRGA